MFSPNSQPLLQFLDRFFVPLPLFPAISGTKGKLGAVIVPLFFPSCLLPFFGYKQFTFSQPYEECCVKSPSSPRPFLCGQTAASELLWRNSGATPALHPPLHSSFFLSFHSLFPSPTFPGCHVKQSPPTTTTHLYKVQQKCMLITLTRLCVSPTPALNPRMEEGTWLVTPLVTPRHCLLCSFGGGG